MIKNSSTIYIELTCVEWCGKDFISIEIHDPDGFAKLLERELGDGTFAVEYRGKVPKRISISVRKEGTYTVEEETRITVACKKTVAAIFRKFHTVAKMEEYRQVLTGGEV